MSVVLGKRNRIDEATEDRGSWTEKRRRKVGYQPSRELVELVCQQRSDKLRKLQQLFPTMEPHILDKVLSDCQENLELSIQLLSSLRLEPSDPAKDYASELIQSLTAVSSREEAESLATRAFQSFAHRVKQQEQAELISQNQQLSGQLQILLNDNALLKRAILKLNAKLQEALDASQPVATLVLDPSGNSLTFFSYKAVLADSELGAGEISPEAIKEKVKYAIRREDTLAIHLTNAYTLQEVFHPSALSQRFLVKSEVTDEDLDMYWESAYDTYRSLQNFKFVVVVKSHEIPAWANEFIDSGRLLPVRIIG